MAGAGTNLPVFPGNSLIQGNSPLKLCSPKRFPGNENREFLENSPEIRKSGNSPDKSLEPVSREYATKRTTKGQHVKKTQTQLPKKGKNRRVNRNYSIKNQQIGFPQKVVLKFRLLIMKLLFVPASVVLPCWLYGRKGKYVLY